MKVFLYIRRMSGVVTRSAYASQRRGGGNGCAAGEIDDGRRIPRGALVEINACKDRSVSACSGQCFASRLCNGGLRAAGLADSRTSTRTASGTTCCAAICTFSFAANSAACPSADPPSATRALELSQSNAVLSFYDGQTPDNH